MNYTIAVLKGDGIGPEIMGEAIKVLDKVALVYSHHFTYTRGYLGGESIDKYGVPLSEETVALCKEADAVLLGAVGGERWNNLDSSIRPERGLLAIRKELELFANLRPAIMFEALKESSPLKESIVKDGLDIMVVRELTGGIYFGRREYSEQEAYDTMYYSRGEIERIAIEAFKIAQKRGKKLVSVDKHNVLDTSKLWRKTVEEVAEDFPDVRLSHMYVDNAAMQLVVHPARFDVILTENMFGDILSDEASILTGSIGMLPSASLGGKTGLYEPVHGSAPDIAGQGKANPIAMILSAGMMLKYSFGLLDESEAIERAVNEVLEEGYRTADICTEGKTLLTTSEMGDRIAERI